MENNTFFKTGLADGERVCIDGPAVRLEALALLLASALLYCCSPEVSPVADLPPVDGLSPDPKRLPRAPKETPGQVSVRQILCAYRGARNAPRHIKLTRKQAGVRAGHLLELTRAAGQDFADLAKKYSDEASTSLSGGDLGVVGRGRLHPDLERAAFGLGPGQVSAVVESPRGFHILQRHPPTEFQAAEIAITYNGAKQSRRYRLRIPRTRDEAGQLAERIHQKILAGSPFYPEAIAHSDLFNFENGGVYPVFKQGTQPPKLEEIVSGLRVGEISGIIETDTGFHIVKRLPVHRIQARQILIEHLQPGEAAGAKKRSREEARQLAQRVRALALKPGSDFSALAAEYSDGPAANRGGENEPFGRGQRTYAFDQAAFSLEVGEISEVVEAQVGFLIVKRIR
jgi:parvulin-like peptidyl-prolyl isomerase